MPGRQPLAPNHVTGTRSSNPLPSSGESGANLTSSDEIMSAVWPGTVVEDSNLPTQILALRRVLVYVALADPSGAPDAL
jgi:hypothetical protein